MTPADQKLFPGQFFLERRNSPTGNWVMISRDRDEAVMRSRFEYAVETRAVGQEVQLVNPRREVVLTTVVGVTANDCARMNKAEKPKRKPLGALGATVI